MAVVDSGGAPAYEGEGRFLADGAWTLRRADGASAAITQRGARAWSVDSADGGWTFASRFRWFALEFHVEGGPFSGALLQGSTFTRAFTLVRAGAPLARIDGNVSCAQDAHRITMLEAGNGAEWLAVTLALVLVQQRTGASAD